MQLAAWIELVEMTGDPSFADAVRRTAQPFWREIMSDSGMDIGTCQQHMLVLTNAAKQAVTEGIAPDSYAAMEIVQVWSRDLERVMEPATISRLFDHLVSTHDPRLAHYWRLITAVKRMPWDKELHDASAWIVEAIRHLLEAWKRPDELS